MSEEIYKEIDADGTIRYFNEHKQYHRVDGPAIEWSSGTKDWCQNGKHHRTDGPAIEYASGDKYWYQNGELHRTDGPAIEHANGNKGWYQNGRLHRTDGPAIEWANGNKEWYQNGKLHRLDGPAIEPEDKALYQSWYQYGQHIRTCIPKILTIQEDGVEKQISICCIECVRFYKNISEEKFHKLSLLL